MLVFTISGDREGLVEKKGIRRVEETDGLKVVSTRKIDNDMEIDSECALGKYKHKMPPRD